MAAATNRAAEEAAAVKDRADGEVLQRGEGRRCGTAAAALLAQPKKEQRGQTRGHSEGHLYTSRWVYLGVRGCVCVLTCVWILYIVYVTPGAV